MQTSTFYFKAVLETNPPSLFALHSLQKTFTFHSENSFTQNAMSKTLFLLDLLDSHKALQQPCLSPISQQSPRAAVTRGSIRVRDKELIIYRVGNIHIFIVDFVETSYQH